jgi:WS/DGAT/MGAT family acyltransferase
MQQLSALDNLFVQTEAAGTPMHVTPVMIYDPPGGKGGAVRFEDILEHFSACLHKSNVFRRRLHHAPLDADQPYWLEDPDFDLEYHIRHIALPRPGDWHQLCQQLARLHERPLDMTRPLWEVYVIEGLDRVEGLRPGSFCLVLKIHHSAIDGIAGIDVINAIHDIKPGRPKKAEADDWQPESPPGTLGLMWRAYAHGWKRSAGLLGSVGGVIGAFIRAGDVTDEKLEYSAGEKTRFNHALSPHRVVDALLVDLRQIKKIKDALPGATVNDVMVTIVGGALRRYLSAHGELPESTLVAGAPINTRGESERGVTGNFVSMMRIPLFTDLAEPLERLAAVHAESVKSKAYAGTVVTPTLTGVAENVSPLLLALGVRAISTDLLSDHLPVPIHTLVSNIPGLRSRLYLGTARLRHVLGFGPATDLVGLFHAITGTENSMAISINACSRMLPDPEFYAACLRESYEELGAAAE